MGVKVGDGCGDGKFVGGGVGEGEFVGDGACVGVDIAGALGFGAVRKGTKFTLPKLKSLLKS